MDSRAVSALTAWQQRAFLTPAGALASGRLGHALLVVGPDGIGKRAVARALAQRLLCQSTPTSEGHACGACRGCQLYAAGTHPDLREVGIEFNEKTNKLRSEILAEQIRELARWFALTAQFGAAQVALIEPAEGMRGAAANALLKTLEEPLPGRYLILLSAQPGRLPATIRSRCQRLDVALPSAAEAAVWLQQQGVEVAVATEALSATGGNPGLALAYVREARLPLRRQVMDDLAGLASGRERAITVALRWGDDSLPVRLRFAAELARDVGAASLGAVGAMTQELAGLTACRDFPKLAAWFDEANRTRQLLDAPLRVDLMLTGLLQSWSDAFRP